MKPSELNQKTVEELTQMAAVIAEDIRATETAVRMHSFRRVNELAVLKKSRARVLTEIANKRTITHS